jgi:lipid II:glycine glycyltransferase (peptidoglycan interpeptide bridge formation enzyme)
LIDHLSELGVDELIIRPTPREQHTYPTAYTEFQLSNQGFEIKDRELTNVIDLRRITDDRFDIYERSCRSKIRKSERNGVEIEEWSEDWESFHEILVKTQLRHGEEPTHAKSELKQLDKLFPDRTRLCMAYYNEKPIAGIFEFLVNERSNFHFYNCHLKDYRDLAPVNQLLDREIKWSLEQGFDFLDLGTTVEEFEWNDGLMRFKESFGATGHLRDVYQLHL